MNDQAKNEALPAVVDRATWQAERDALLAREKAHTREGDAIAAARRRLPMVEVDGTLRLTGENGPVTLLEVFRYRDFMDWDVPWYSAQESVDALLGVPQRSLSPLVCYLRNGSRVFETYWTTGRGLEPMAPTYGLLDLTVYGRQETWENSPEGWPQGRIADASQWRINGRPTAQWPRLEAGRDDDLSVTSS